MREGKREHGSERIFVFRFLLVVEQCYIVIPLSKRLDSKWSEMQESLGIFLCGLHTVNARRKVQTLGCTGFLLFQIFLLSIPGIFGLTLAHFRYHHFQ